MLQIEIEKKIVMESAQKRSLNLKRQCIVYCFFLLLFLATLAMYIIKPPKDPTANRIMFWGITLTISLYAVLAA